MGNFHSGKMDWHAFENRLRAVLKTALTQKVDGRPVYDFALLLQEVSLIVGEETGRGHELPDDWHKRFEGLQK